MSAIRRSHRALQIWHASWPSSRVYLFALLIFAASRAVVILGVNLGTVFGQCGDAPFWYEHLMKWDADWYRKIVTNGYFFIDDPGVQSSVNFYPLYPLISYAVKSIFRIDAGLALFLVANAASLVLLLIMTKFVKDELGEQVSLLTISLFFFFPASLFLSAGYSEPLCLMFIVLSLMLLTRRYFFLSAVAAGLSIGAHAKCIGVTPVIVWEMWQRGKQATLLLIARMALCGFVAMSGLFAYMLYLGIKFQHPLAFSSAQRAWHDGTTLFDRILFSATLGPFRDFHLEMGGWFVCALVLTVWSFWYLRFAISLYGLMALAVPYFNLGINISMSRYVIMCIPAFMCLACLWKEKPWLTRPLIGIFAALLLQDATLFSQCRWAG
jgi:hypothetical protein